jgi:hypothetical protein
MVDETEQTTEEEDEEIIGHEDNTNPLLTKAVAQDLANTTGKPVEIQPANITVAPQAERPAAAPTPAPATPQPEPKVEPIMETKPVPKAEEIKVVIVLKGDRGMVGIQSPDCDPIYKTVEGDLNSLLALVPDMVTNAKLQWSINSKYPKAQIPAPPPPPPRPATTPAPTNKKTGSKTATAAVAATPKFF